MDFTDYMGEPDRRRHASRANAPCQETIFVNSEKDTSLSRMTVPFVLVLVGGVALVGITWGAASNFNQLGNDVRSGIGRVEDRLKNVEGNLTSRLGHLEEAQQNMMSRHEHDAWCRVAEAINVQNGWKCASLRDQHMRLAPRLKGWTVAPEK
jgi:hypothetical protein